MQLNAELFGALQAISSDEGLMKNAVRSLKRIAAQKAKSEETMSMAELEDIVRQGDKEIAEGNFCRSGDGSVIYLPPTQGDKRGSRTKKRKPRGLPFLYF